VGQFAGRASRSSLARTGRSQPVSTECRGWRCLVFIWLRVERLSNFGKQAPSTSATCTAYETEQRPNPSQGGSIPCSPRKRGGEAVLGGPGRSAKAAISRQGSRKNARYALLCCSVPHVRNSNRVRRQCRLCSTWSCRYCADVLALFPQAGGPVRSGSSPRRVGFTKLAANFHRPGGTRAPPRDGVESSRCTVGPSVLLLAARLSRGGRHDQQRESERKRNRHYFAHTSLLSTATTHAYSSHPQFRQQQRQTQHNGL
jgi:hypothetical protein